ncbi:TPA: SGNH/GDSL hydrolase family protein [Vibrio cholerae]
MIYEEDRRDTILSFVAAITNPFLLEKQAIKLIAFGDSITDIGDSSRNISGGYIISTRGYWCDAFVQSQQQFYLLDGAGISGNTTLDLLNRMSDVTSTDADVVLLLIGTNDLGQGRTPEQARDSMEQILDQIIASGKKVLITRIPLRKPSDNLNQKINQLNAYYEQLAVDRNNDVAITDNLTEFNQYVESGNGLVVTTDELHPNSFGAWLIAKETRKTLDSKFNSIASELVNLAPNPSFSGASGLVLNGATGLAPADWRVYYADPENGLGGSALGSVISQDGSVTLTTGTDAAFRQALFRTGNVLLPNQNEKYVFGLTVSCSDLTNASELKVYILTSLGVSVEFQVNIPAGLLTFENVRLLTPPIDVKDASSCVLNFSLKSSGAESVQAVIKNPILVQVS